MPDVGSEFSVEHKPGDDGRPTVAFMSALFAGGWLWERQFQALTAQGWPVLRTVEPICGLESRITGSIQRLGDVFMEACADADRLVVCANSLGGLVGLDLAARYPDRIAGVVLSGAPGLTPDPDVGLSVDRRSGVLPSGPAFQKAMLGALFHGDPLFTQEQIDMVASALSTGPAMLSVARSLRATQGYPVEKTMDQVGCPSLYVWGAHDRMTPPEPWEEMVSGKDNGEFVGVPECGHIPMIEAPDAYDAHLLRFLERVAG
ncbi:alpha/beta hydrolase [Pseudonocardia nematodicida]|uniref:Alpha/beta hydrolase n=1 Tax=Pseudonocardia nematodicida TaxID=1206997 RepID=A0ABV1K7Q9_9PSEU